MRRLFLLIHAALIALCAAPVPGAAQETPDTAAISVVRAVMEHRIIWLQDPTLFNPCRLYEVLGGPDDLGRRSVPTPPGSWTNARSRVRLPHCVRRSPFSRSRSVTPLPPSS